MKFNALLGMLLPLSYATTVINFLTERYLIGGKVDDIYYFYTLDGGTIIGLTVENTGILVAYFDITNLTETKSSDAVISIFESFRQQTMFK
ncbi:MAG: hypothetical protein J6X20_04945 [Bacteroidales bacterium]|nr:hypothetical protein [Bacteroidales bacterium]